MQFQNTLIVDDRKELSVKYKKQLLTYCNCFAEIMSSENDKFYEYINENEPDLILISDSISQNVGSVCKKIRTTVFNYRPIIVVLSKSDDVHDRINVLNAGADDFLSEPIENEEFIARVNAHLRRRLEDFSSRITRLPMADITIKVLHHKLSSDEKWAVLMIDIDHFNEYQQIYGDIAANKMLQTYAAIIKASISKDDYLGQLDKNNFVVITNVLKAEKLSSFVKYAFDTVANKFYSEKDVKLGYITLEGDDVIGQRISIVTTSIAVVTNQYKNYENYQQLLNELSSLHKLAKLQPGSFCLTNNPNLCASDSIEKHERNKILIMEKDAALAYLISITLNMQGYITEAISNYDQIYEKIQVFSPDLIILDSGSIEEQRGFEMSEIIKQDACCSTIKVIVSTIIHDKQKVLKTGADLYLPKPYNIKELLSWVDRFLKY